MLIALELFRHTTKENADENADMSAGEQANKTTPNI